MPALVIIHVKSGCTGKVRNVIIFWIGFPKQTGSGILMNNAGYLSMKFMQTILIINLFILVKLYD